MSVELKGNGRRNNDSRQLYSQTVKSEEWVERNIHQSPCKRRSHHMPSEENLEALCTYRSSNYKGRHLLLLLLDWKRKVRCDRYQHLSSSPICGGCSELPRVEGDPHQSNRQIFPQRVWSKHPCSLSILQQKK